MRVNGLDLSERCPFICYKELVDSQQNFADYVQIALEERVVVLVDAAGQRILDRHHTMAECPGRDSAEHVAESRHGRPFPALAEVLQCRELSEGAPFTCECNGQNNLLA
jgi:hypothetical protein